MGFTAGRAHYAPGRQRPKARSSRKRDPRWLCAALDRVGPSAGERQRVRAWLGDNGQFGTPHIGSSPVASGPPCAWAASLEHPMACWGGLTPIGRHAAIARARVSPHSRTYSNLVAGSYSTDGLPWVSLRFPERRNSRRARPGSHGPPVHRPQTFAASLLSQRRNHGEEAPVGAR